MKCEVCGKKFKPKRPWARFCSVKCRVKNHRGLPTEEECKEATRQVRARAADKKKELTEEGRTGGRKWFSSPYQELVDAGLPANCTVAARVLGINEDTLRRRIERGTDLLKPLRRRKSVNRKAAVELKVPATKEIKGIHVHRRAKDICVRQSRQSVGDDAVEL